MQGSKYNKEVEEFENAFSNFRDKKIVIYGTGRMTATLIGRVQGFNIIGLCDRDTSLVGKSLYGKRIIAQEEAEREADLLIINTWDAYWNTIYERIKNWRIPIYYRNGMLAFDRCVQVNENHAYWNTSTEKLQAEIGKADIISFDVFDTILMRKIFVFSDIFRIVEEKIARYFGEEIELVNLRKSAASMGDNLTIDEIYDNIGKLTGWDATKLEYIKKCEIETDVATIIGRKDIVDVCNEAIKEKQVYFISDMYYTTEVLQRLLKEVGIHAKKEQIIVSCEHNKTKADGNLWKWYKECIVKNKKAIHVGDNYESDYKKALENGINAYYIMSSREMLENSSISSISAQVVKLYDSLSIGCICAKLFNSPFALNESRGTIIFENEKQAGYVLLGTVAYSFNLWLIEKALENKKEQILFFARDGFLLIEQCKELCKNLQLDKEISLEYLEISRNEIWKICIFSKEDIYQVAQFPYNGNLKGLLWDRYGIKPEECKTEIPVSELQKDKELLQLALRPFEDLIIENARKEREKYCNYLQKLNIKENPAIVDLWLQGTTQYYFSKLLKQHTIGFYFYACLNETNDYAKENTMLACFQKNSDLSGKDGKLIQYMNFVESFYTAPHGVMTGIEDDGEIQYARSMTNQNTFQCRIDMQQGILEFIKEIVLLQQEMGIINLQNNPRFADEIFGDFMDRGFEPTVTMKKSFFYDNAVMNNKEFPIWE